MSQLSNKLIIKDPFEMPAVDDTTVLVLRECADLVPHCWIWNESVGYLEVVEYSGYDIYITVKNVGMKENATSGTIFPSCMEFLITAPNATPIIDNTVTCLRADFKCPTVGQEALMSVDSTSAIRKGDLIIVDTRYQYLVTEIINEHTMKVLNEEKGKEGGVIDVKCNECVPVKIFESTHCCEALQEQVDDIYNRLDTKKSITPATDSLVSVSNGSQVLTDAFNDVVLDVDTDLSKYDNTISRFITSNDIPSLPNDIDLSHYDNATSKFITLNDIPQIPTVNDATLTIYNSDGATPFIEFSANAASNVTATLPQSGANLIYFEELYDKALTTARFVPNTNSVATSYSLGNSNNWINESYIENTRVKTLIGQNYTDGITYPSSNSVGHAVIYDAGTIFQTRGRHVFKSGGATVLSITEDKETVATGNIVPESDNSVCIGGSGKSFAEGYINNIHSNLMVTDSLELNGTTYNTIPGLIATGHAGMTTTIPYNTALTNATYTDTSNTVTITNPYNRPIKVFATFTIPKAVLNISSGNGNNVHYQQRVLFNYGSNVIESYQVDIQSPTSTSTSIDERCTVCTNRTQEIAANGSLSFYWSHIFKIVIHQGTVTNKQYFGFNYFTDYFVWFA